VDEELPTPQYKVGDFVRCSYSFYQYYYYYYDEDSSVSIHGIVVDIEYAQYEGGWEPDIIYIVYCTDGVYRFFVEEEIRKLS